MQTSRRAITGPDVTPMRVTIVGGGILGVTLGTLLRLARVPTTLISAELPHEVDPALAAPNLASAYPAASIIPHSVAGATSEELRFSLEVFARLPDFIPEVVRRQWHYEVFEDRAPEPPYLDLLTDVEDVSSGAGTCPLQRGRHVAVVGWRYRIFFAEFPRYLELLFDVFRALGGQVLLQTVRGPGDLARLDGDLLVLGAGMGTPDLLGTGERKYFEEGRLLEVPFSLAALTRPAASYNYTPRVAVHPDGAGGAMDVYAYPRRESLILGGTRLQGCEGERGGAYSGPTLEVEDVARRTSLIPAAIVELNRLFLRQLLGLEISTTPIRVLVGRRYRGSSPTAGITRASVSRDGRPLLACYGLGGAGVTLSWGLAASLFQMLRHTCQELREETRPAQAERIGTLFGQTARDLQGNRG